MNIKIVLKLVCKCYSNLAIFDSACKNNFISPEFHGERMVSEIWLLRAGLWLELLGGLLLSLDVFSTPIRGKLVTVSRKMVRKIMSLLILVLLFPLYFYVILESLVGGFLRPIIFVSHTDITKLFLEIPLISWWTGVLIRPVFWNIRIEQLVFILIMSLLVLLETAYIYLESRDYSPPLKWPTIWPYLSAVVLVLILFLLPSFLSWYIPGVVLSLVLGVCLVSPITPVLAGFYLQNQGIVKSGLRFSGFLFLSVGFLIQLIWTFLPPQ